MCTLSKLGNYIERETASQTEAEILSSSHSALAVTVIWRVLWQSLSHGECFGGHWHMARASVVTITWSVLWWSLSYGGAWRKFVLNIFWFSNNTPSRKLSWEQVHAERWVRWFSQWRACYTSIWIGVWAPSTQVEKLTVVVHTILSVLWGWRNEDLWSSLASSCTFMGELQAQWKILSRKLRQTHDRYPPLASTHAHMCIYTCMHLFANKPTFTHTSTDTNSSLVALIVCSLFLFSQEPQDRCGQHCQCLEFQTSIILVYSKTRPEEQGSAEWNLLLNACTRACMHTRALIGRW